MEWWAPVTARPAPTLPPDFFDRGPASTAERTGAEIATTATVRTTTTTSFPWREAAAAVLDGVGEAMPDGGEGVDVWVVGVASVAGTVIVGVLGAWVFRRVTGRNMYV